jgi:succinyl-diaminopimelate desuccinylase
VLYSALELTKKLISYHSITPHQAGAIDFIENLLKSNGFNVFKYESGPQDFITTNLYAVKGNNGPNLCFAGHIDVVPTGDLEEWASMPFNPIEVEGTLFGRGAVDMKGAVGASLAAVLNYISKNTISDFKLSFLLTSDEEGPGTYGTKELLKEIYAEGHKIDFAIIGEPTCEQNLGDVIKIGRRGSINFELEVIGEQGHVAYPAKALNPHPALITILNKLINYKFDDGNKFFDPSSLQVTSIDTDNNTTNLIPLKATARFNIRYNSEHTTESLFNIIKANIEEVTSNYHLQYHSSAEPFIGEMSNYKREFALGVQDITGVAPKYSTSGGTSDARFIKNYCDFLEFGLLNSTAHKIDECCKISDLQMLYNVYYMSIEKFKKL